MYVDCNASKVAKRLGILGRIRKYFSAETCKTLHKSLAQPRVYYSFDCVVKWQEVTVSLERLVLKLQKCGVHLINTPK